MPYTTSKVLTQAFRKQAADQLDKPQGKSQKPQDSFNGTPVQNELARAHNRNLPGATNSAMAQDVVTVPITDPSMLTTKPMN